MRFLILLCFFATPSALKVHAPKNNYLLHVAQLINHPALSDPKTKKAILQIKGHCHDAITHLVTGVVNTLPRSRKIRRKAICTQKLPGLDPKNPRHLQKIVRGGLKIWHGLSIALFGYTIVEEYQQAQRIGKSKKLQKHNKGWFAMIWNAFQSYLIMKPLGVVWIISWAYIVVFSWWQTTLNGPSQDDYIDRYAASASAVFGRAKGEYMRIVSSMFLHGDWLHLFGNTMSTITIMRGQGTNMEWKSLLLVFITTGIFGNLAQMRYDIKGKSVGASGAIYGMVGYFAMRKYMWQDGTIEDLADLLIENLAPLTLTSLSAYIPDLPTPSAGIGHAAHFGGFAAGVLIGWADQHSSVQWINLTNPGTLVLLGLFGLLWYSLKSAFTK